MAIKQKLSNEQGLSLCFTGDISFTKYFSSINSISNLFDSAIIDFLNSSDYCIANIEGPVLDNTIDNYEQFNHYSKLKDIEILNKININIWNLSNNHIFDFGINGLTQTLNNAKRNNINTLGLITPEEDNSILYFENSNGTKVGILSLTYVEQKHKEYLDNIVNWDDFENISEKIARIKQTCRWCVVVVHGGDEFSYMPMPDIRGKYLNYLDMGADIVIGHHPHVVQNFEFINDKIIFYSIGNFIFDTNYQRTQSYTETGILLKIFFKTDSISWEYFPIKINRSNQTVQKGKIPVIFQNINGSEYKLLWKFAASALLRNERIALQYLNPKRYKKYNFFLWMLRDLKMLKNKRKRMLLKGKYFKIFFLPLNIKKFDLINYMKS